MHVLRRDERVANEGEMVTETRLLFSTEVRISEMKAFFDD